MNVQTRSDRLAERRPTGRVFAALNSVMNNPLMQDDIISANVVGFLAGEYSYEKLMLFHSARNGTVFYGS